MPQEEQTQENSGETGSQSPSTQVSAAPPSKDAMLMDRAFSGGTNILAPVIERPLEIAIDLAGKAPLLPTAWDAGKRALGDGIIGLKTTEQRGVAGVYDLANGEVYATTSFAGGKLDLGSLDGRIGDPRGAHQGLVKTNLADSSVDSGNLHGVRFEKDSAFNINGHPVSLDLKAGEQAGRFAVTGGVKTDSSVMSGVLTYGASFAAAAGRDGFARIDAFADYSVRSDKTALNVSGQISATFGSSKNVMAIVNGNYEQKIASGLTAMANAHLRGDVHGRIGAAVDVGVYKDISSHYNLRLGPYVEADTDRGVKVGVALRSSL